jgi:two-component system chemotaxis sensor kinase CheA
LQNNWVNAFLQESEDLLAEIEDVALALDGGESSKDDINRLFRAFHTIKGSGAMCGMHQVSAFTHHVETLLDKVRSGGVSVSPELAAAVLAAKDQIKLLLICEQGGAAIPPGSSEKLIASLEVLSAANGEEPAAPIVSAPAASQKIAAALIPAAEKQNWRICFRPSPGILACGGNPTLLFRDLRKLGLCEIYAHTEAVPALDEIKPNLCYCWWTIALHTAADENAIRDVFMFVEDGSELEIKAEATPRSQPAATPALPAAVQPTADAKALPAQPAAVHKALVKESTVRVPAERLDRLVNLVGELVMNQSRLAQVATQVGAPELASPVEEIERLVSELRDDVLGIRMLPIGSIFGRFRRLVHDLSSELGKEVDLVTEGAETELDKSILDQLGEPLVHLLRNCVDHGIEPVEERIAQGKRRRGTIRLTAEHTGSNVVIAITDDGRGISQAAVRAKAIERRLIAPDASLSDKELFNLILLPGFSTAQQVTSVSGRGVGMDVVKKQIDALRGSLNIGSNEGRGTRISLSLPLTLAIIDGLRVQVGADQYIIPMAAVMENVELERAERARHNGRNVIAVRGEQIPYIDLREAFHMDGDAPSIEKVVIVHYEDARVGLVVDRVLGSHQTVIQSLGRFFRDIDVVSGATIMGDGLVALIMDVPAIVRFADGRCHPASVGPASVDARCIG